MLINDSADSGIFVDAVSGLSLVDLFMDSNGAQAEGGAIQDSGIHIEDLIGASNTISQLDDPGLAQHQPRLGPQQQHRPEHAHGDQHHLESRRRGCLEPGQRRNQPRRQRDGERQASWSAGGRSSTTRRRASW